MSEGSIESTGGEYVRFILRFICSSLEWLCRLTHPFSRIEIWLTDDYCNLADLSHWMDEKYNLDVWIKK